MSAPPPPLLRHHGVVVYLACVRGALSSGVEGFSVTGPCKKLKKTVEGSIDIDAIDQSKEFDTRALNYKMFDNRY